MSNNVQKNLNDGDNSIKNNAENEVRKLQDEINTLRKKSLGKNPILKVIVKLVYSLTKHFILKCVTCI